MTKKYIITILFSFIFLLGFSHFIFANYLARKKVGFKIFDTKPILFVSIGLIVLSTILSMLYEHIIIRYSFIIVIILILFFKRNNFITIFKEIKKKS